MSDLSDSRVSWNVPHASPVVLFHGKVVKGLHAEVDTKTITHQGVHYPL